MQPGVGNAVLKAALTTGALSLAGDLLAQSFTQRHGKVRTSTAAAISSSSHEMAFLNNAPVPVPCNPIGAS